MVHGQSYANLLHWVVSLWQQNCYCICSEGAVTGIALVHSLKASHVTWTVAAWKEQMFTYLTRGEPLRVREVMHRGTKGASLCCASSSCRTKGPFTVWQLQWLRSHFGRSWQILHFQPFKEEPVPSVWCMPLLHLYLLTDSTEVCCKTFCKAKSKSKGSNIQAWKRVSYSVSEKYGWRLKDLLSKELILSREITVF